MAGVVVSVNVGTPREVGYRGNTVRTAIWKAPVAGPVKVGGHKVEGDEQGNPEVHVPPSSPSGTPPIGRGFQGRVA